MGVGWVELLTRLVSQEWGSGLYLHPDGVAETTAFTLTNPIMPREVTAVWLNTVNLAQNTTFRLYTQVTAGEYRAFLRHVWVLGDEIALLLPGYVVPLGIAMNLRLTVQSAVAEGAARTIRYVVLQKRASYDV